MIDLTKLHALADGELSEEEARLVREQVRGSEADGLELNAIYNLRDCVRTKAQVFTCEVTFVASMKRVAELDRKHRVDSFVTRYAWGISGAFLALIAIGGVMTRSFESNRVQSSDLASTFAKLIPSSSQGPAPTAESNSYDQWLDSLLQRARKLSVRGVAYGSLNGHSVEKVGLQDVDGDMALLLIQGNVNVEGMSATPGANGFVSGKLNGLNCVSYNDGSRTIFILGDRSFDKLATTLKSMIPAKR